MSEATRTQLWQRAASFAARSHLGQFRHDGETPYAAHPFRVAMTVREVFDIDDPTALCAALLHDVIEDTTADYDDLLEQFGEEIAQTVADLTKDMRMPEAMREAEYDSRLAAASWQAKLVKLADVYDNVCDSLTTEGKSAKAIDKAHRAIALAGDNPKLQKAVQAVTALIETCNR